MTKKLRRPTYQRASEPPGMRLTERDMQILETIYTHEGVMADYQLQRLFFSGRRTAQERLSKLYHNGYLERPDRRGRAALPYMVYWLAEEGAAQVAALRGEDVREFKYRDTPRWALVRHDVAVNDFRLDVEEAVGQIPELELVRWTPSSEFWSYPDPVEYKLPDGSKKTRRVRPDGYFALRWGNSVHRRLLEIERTDKDNPRFGREKVLPGLAYLGSQAYETRFGDRSGRWLFVTVSERKLLNLKAQTERLAGRNAGVFGFTTFDLVRPETVLTAPIWWVGGREEQVTLLEM